MNLYKCKKCGVIISEMGLCAFECEYDTDYIDARPKGTVLKLTFELVKEEEYEPIKRTLEDE